MCLIAQDTDLLLVERFVIEQGCVTSRQVSARINKSLRICQHLLKTLGENKRIQRVGLIGEDRRQRMVVWALPDYAGLDEHTRRLLDEQDEAAQNLPGDGLPLVLRRDANEWPRAAAHRDAMIAALYGPAAGRVAA